MSGLDASHSVGLPSGFSTVKRSLGVVLKITWSPEIRGKARSGVRFNSKRLF